jgi:hypothetical protein
VWSKLQFSEGQKEDGLVSMKCLKMLALARSERKKSRVGAGQLGKKKKDGEGGRQLAEKSVSAFH